MTDPTGGLSAPIQHDGSGATPPSRPGFFRTVYKHLKSWSAEYSTIILTMLSVIVTAQMYYLLTGRRPEENMSWLVDFSPRAIAIALAITFTSLARQAFGNWYATEDLLDRPALAIAHGAKSTIIFAICLYVLTH